MGFIARMIERVVSRLKANRQPLRGEAQVAAPCTELCDIQDLFIHTYRKGGESVDKCHTT